MMIARRIVGCTLVLAAVLGVAGVIAASASAAPVAPARPAGGPRTSARLVPRAWQRPGAPRAGAMRLATASGTTPTPITACGTEITTPGTYSLASNLTDTGTYCVWIATNDVTLNFDGHKITGDGTDQCVLVQDKNTDRSVKDDTITGKGALHGCQYGIETDYSTRTVASKLKISPGSSSTTSDRGVYEQYSADDSFSHINVKDGSGSAYGFYLYYGSGNQVSSSSVTSTGSSVVGFYVEYEYDDSLSGDKADYPSGAGGTNTGFADYYSNRDTYSGDTAIGQLVGFYLYEDDEGIVTAKNDSYSNPMEDASGSYGFYTRYAYDNNNYGYQNHSTLTGNSDDGGDYGYYDVYNIAALYNNNTASDNDGFGFYFYEPPDYTITGNTSDGAPSFKHDAYGFFFYYAYSDYAPTAFNDNTSEYNYYGFYSTASSGGGAIHGTGNTAKHDTHDSYGVEVK